jgi:hypothetical protein
MKLWTEKLLFAVYLMTRIVKSGYIVSIDWMIMNNDVEIMWKEVVVA